MSTITFIFTTVINIFCESTLCLKVINSYSHTSMIAAAQAQNVGLISGACRSRCADWRLLRTSRDPPATSRRDMCAHRDVRTFNGSTNSWVGLFCLAADLSLLCRARRLDLRRGPSPWNRRSAGRRLAAAAAAHADMHEALMLHRSSPLSSSSFIMKS